MRRTWMVAAAVALTAVGGCGGLGSKTFAQPQVTLKDVKLTGVGLTGGSLDVVLNVYNPNNFRLDASRMTYRVMMDTVGLANGAIDQMTTVQSKDSTAVRIPVNFTYSGLGEAGRQILNTGSVNYRVLGDLVVATPLGNFTVPYDRTGRFSTVVGNTR
jgi:LEA14-like dessication related protein